MIKNLLCAAVLMFLVSGCAYYKVTDPGSGRVYYTDNWISGRYGWTGALRFQDIATGDEVTLQNSQVRQVSHDEVTAATGK